MTTTPEAPMANYEIDFHIPDLNALGQDFAWIEAHEDVQAMLALGWPEHEAVAVVAYDFHVPEETVEEVIRMYREG